MLWFIIGAVFGGFVGVTITCCCVAASDADRHIDDNRK